MSGWAIAGLIILVIVVLFLMIKYDVPIDFDDLDLS